MTPGPRRDTTGGRVYNDLRNLARREGRDSAEFFTLYALEGFLARLVASEHAEDFVLKGGVLMAAFAARRPTRDIDLAAISVSNGIPEIEHRVRAVLANDLDDGLTFDLKSVTGEVIRDATDYPGVRIHMTANLATAHIALHLDVNFGDPIWPAPTEAELPLLLGGTLRLRGYPDYMVLAEKIVTAIERGELNTRWRDFVDIDTLARTRQLTYNSMRTAIETVAGHRKVQLQPLEPLLARMSELAQRKWDVWRRKQRLQATTPEPFSDLLDACTAFADPVLDGIAAGHVWNPITGMWEPCVLDEGPR